MSLHIVNALGNKLNCQEVYNILKQTIFKGSNFTAV